MRQIEIDLDVFAMIWSLRQNGETDENAVLRRLLLGSTAYKNEIAGSESGHEVAALYVDQLKEVNTSKFPAQTVLEGESQMMPIGKIRWVDDVVTVLNRFGGTASLHDIYREVRALRKSAGRSIPRTLDAVIRRTLEDHSSDSANFRAQNLFKIVGRGEWALR